MILAIDVYYKNNKAKTVGAFFNWEDEKPKQIIINTTDIIEEYIPGQFYKRELPCILQLLKKVDLSIIEVIIVDGHVYISNDKTFGLGGHLYQALEKKLPIIGLAKKSFINTDEVSFPIYRGESKVPLYVSVIGYDIEKAILNIKKMKGKFRIPSILKKLDSITKES